MRSYDIGIASLAIMAPVKWTDNLLSQHVIPDVASTRRRVARRIPHSALIQLAIIRQLHIELGLGVRDAVRISKTLGDTKGEGVHQGGQIRLTVDRPAIERELEGRLRDALESAPTPRRGRPAREARA